QHPIAGQHLEVALLGILWQITDFPITGDGAGVRLTLACQDPHGGGLPGAVAPDEPDPVARLHPQRRAGADLEVRCGDHAGTPYLSSVKTGARFSARAATASSKLPVSKRTKSCPRPSACMCPSRLAASSPLHSVRLVNSVPGRENDAISPSS